MAGLQQYPGIPSKSGETVVNQSDVAKSMGTKASLFGSARVVPGKTMVNQSDFVKSVGLNRTLLGFYSGSKQVLAKVCQVLPKMAVGVQSSVSKRHPSVRIIQKRPEKHLEEY